MSWLPKKKVVVPVDFSDESFAAVEAALGLVASSKDLYLTYVLPLLEPSEPGVIWNTIDNASRTHHAEQALREKLSDPKYKEAQVYIAFGDPGSEIAEFAQRIGAELIVIPSHGRRGLSRLLIGSVAERVIRLAHCPVLVLKS